MHFAMASRSWREVAGNAHSILTRSDEEYKVVVTAPRDESLEAACSISVQAGRSPTCKAFPGRSSLARESSREERLLPSSRGAMRSTKLPPLRDGPLHGGSHVGRALGDDHAGRFEGGDLFGGRAAAA